MFLLTISATRCKIISNFTEISSRVAEGLARWSYGNHTYVNGANSNGEIRQMKIFSASVSFTVPVEDFLIVGAA